MQIALHKVLLKIVLFAGFLVALDCGFLNIVPKAEASYGTRGALETIGVSTGIGAVLGLSTISFYDAPTAHFKNVLFGAGAGLIVGIGVASYLLANSSDEDEINPEEIVIPPKPSTKEMKDGEKKIDSAIKNKTSSLKKKFSAPADLLAMRELGGMTLHHESRAGWSIAFEVLELRF